MNDSAIHTPFNDVVVLSFPFINCNFCNLKPFSNLCHYGVRERMTGNRQSVSSSLFLGIDSS